MNCTGVPTSARSGPVCRAECFARVEQAKVVRGVRHERHDWHERQGRVKPTEIQGSPRERAGTDHVRPEAPDAAAPEPERGEQCRSHENRQRQQRERTRGIEHRQDDQARARHRRWPAAAGMGSRDVPRERWGGQSSRRRRCRSHTESPIRGSGLLGRTSMPVSHRSAAGIAIPPMAAASGDTARAGDARAPPGSVASNTSLAARAKKNTIPTSLTQKCKGVRAGRNRADRHWPTTTLQPFLPTAETSCRGRSAPCSSNQQVAGVRVRQIMSGFWRPPSGTRWRYAQRMKRYRLVPPAPDRVDSRRVAGRGPGDRGGSGGTRVLFIGNSFTFG